MNHDEASLTPAEVERLRRARHAIVAILHQTSEEMLFEELDKLARSLVDQSVSQTYLWLLFHEPLEDPNYAGHITEHMDDVLRDILDAVTGWCAQEHWYDKDSSGDLELERHAQAWQQVVRQGTL